MSLCDSCVKGRPLGFVYSVCPSRSPNLVSCTGHQPMWTPQVTPKEVMPVPEKSKKSKTKKIKNTYEPEY